MHTKDVRKHVMEEAGRNGWSFLDSVIAGVYTVPGDGMVDFPSVFKALKGYSGWVVVEAEQDPEKAPPAKYARMGHDHVAEHLKEARLDVAPDVEASHQAAARRMAGSIT